MSKLVNFILNAHVISERKKFELIFIVTGEQSHAEYKEAIEKVEFFNKLIYGAMYISAAFCVFFPLPFIFIRYFVYDMGKNSFVLFVPAWFVYNIIDSYVIYSIILNKWFCLR